MPYINVPINDDLDKRFRNEVNRRLGMKRGNIKIAVEEALELWITQKDEKVIF